MKGFCKFFINGRRDITNVTAAPSIMTERMTTKNTKYEIINTIRMIIIYYSRGLIILFGLEGGEKN